MMDSKECLNLWGDTSSLQYCENASRKRNEREEVENVKAKKIKFEDMPIIDEFSSAQLLVEQESSIWTLAPPSYASPNLPLPTTSAKNFKKIEQVEQSVHSTSHSTAWNQTYQEHFRRVISIDEKCTKTEELQSFMQFINEFNQKATEGAMKIVDEFELADCDKTIKPSDIGGQLGGKKYCIDNILFKVAICFNYKEYDDEKAMKVANHEQKSLNALIGAKINDLHYPLVTRIDYKGFRILAVSILPIKGKETILTGSSDGCQSIFSSPGTTKILEEISTKFHLSKHLVKGTGNKDFVELVGPFDLEFHRGTDQHIYSVDFSRLCPPDNTKGTQNLYCLFRPEFLMNYSEYLCSDAGSRFLDNKDSHEHDKKIDKARDCLLQEEIPKFVQSCKSQTEFTPYQFPEFIDHLHSKGINVRYLGNVLSSFQEVNEGSSFDWGFSIIIEITARTITNIIRKKLRDQRKSGDQKRREILSEFFNSLFYFPGDNHHSSLQREIVKSKWEKEIFPAICKKFGGDVLKQNLCDINDLFHFYFGEFDREFNKEYEIKWRSQLDNCKLKEKSNFTYLLERICDLVELKFGEELNKKISIFFDQPIYFDRSMFEFPVVKKNLQFIRNIEKLLSESLII